MKSVRSQRGSCSPSAPVGRRSRGVESLRRLVEDELTAHRVGKNVSVAGSDLPLNPEAAQALAMVLHELTTSAVKHGALSTVEGHVVVRWQIAGEISSAQLSFVWQEVAGRADVVTPMRLGFDTRLVNHVVHHELGGRVDLSLPPTGVRWEMHVPLARVAARQVESALEGSARH
jgi:two-component sensor histidine kinase